jgi:hypothetical protein
MESDNEKRGKELDQELDQFFENFRNRKRYPFLTVEILATISDDDIEQAIIDYIHSKVLNYEEEYRIVSSLTPGFQMVYSTWEMEGEVSNGGFNQFFYNSGQFAKMALHSLLLIEADDYYQILKKAIFIYRKEKDNQALQDLYSKRTLETFFKTYEMTKLIQCDQAFRRLKNKLRPLRIKFIREHPDQFIGG